MEMLTEEFQMGLAVFGAMLFFVWVLPGVVCRKGKYPEDLPAPK